MRVYTYMYTNALVYSYRTRDYLRNNNVVRRTTHVSLRFLFYRPNNF